MNWIAIALAALGALMLMIGYARKRRGMLALSAIILFVAGSLGGFLDRWVNTARQAEAEARALQGTTPGAPLPPASQDTTTTSVPLPLPPPSQDAPAAPPAP